MLVVYQRLHSSSQRTKRAKKRS